MDPLKTFRRPPGVCGPPVKNHWAQEFDHLIIKNMKKKNYKWTTVSENKNLHIETNVCRTYYAIIRIS